MKKLLLTVGLAALFSITARAEVKIGTIDLRKVFDGYYKTMQADANLKEEAGDLEKERKEMVDGYKKTEEDYKKLLDKSQDQAVSSEERTKSKQAAEKKIVELKDLEQAITTFERSARAKLAEKQRRKRDAILEEIRAVINSKSKSSGFSLVLDTAAESINNTPILLFNTGENDITANVLSELNASAPPGVLKSLEEKKDSKK